MSKILILSTAFIFHTTDCIIGASQVALLVMKPPANAGDSRDADSTPGLGRFCGGGWGNPL